MNIKPFITSGLLLAGVALAACSPKTSAPAADETPLIMEETTTYKEEPIIEDDPAIIQDDTSTTAPEGTMIKDTTPTNDTVIEAQ